MGKSIRCPHCNRDIVPPDAAEFRCGACGKSIRLPMTPAEPPAPASAPAPAPAPAPKAPASAFQRKCPSCGERLEPKVRECPACGTSYRVAAAERDEMRNAESAGYGPEAAGLKKGVVGGLVMMGIAVVWFGLGWMAGRIFFYPPILFVIGLFGLIQGLAEGNVSGKKPGFRRRKP